MESHILTDNGKIITEAIKGRYMITVSDWFFKKETGTSTFIMEGKNKRGCIVADNVVPGYLEDQSSL